MELSNKKGIQDIVLTLAGLGLREIVICPGSRNAPLVISFNRHSDFNCTSIRDERSAGFYALGKSLELGEPVALLCTSGSASLNFAPAIAEAYYQGIPLIVITADRPKEWTDQGDGQTINQTHIYRNYIRKSYELKGDVQSEDDFWFNERNLCEGWQIATQINVGPVHFNVPLQEPLYGLAEKMNREPKLFFSEPVTPQISESRLTDMAEVISENQKVMFLVGQMKDADEVEAALKQLAQRPQITILTESTGNIHDDLFIENIDRCITNLSDEDSEELAPDLLITIGGAIVSKRIKKLLRRFKPIAHWNIHPQSSMMDTFQALTMALPTQPENLLNFWAEKVKSNDSKYQKHWQALRKQKEQKHQNFCKTAPYSDFYVFSKIFEAIPDKEYCLHLSNSSPVRYAQLFNNQMLAATWSNRGTSGIDGCTSTAVGAAAAAPEKDFLLITGDVAFHYDGNALWNNEAIPNLKIIVINNGGGGIFRIISGPDEVEETGIFLETQMSSSIEKMADQYHWQYLTAIDETSLENALNQFFSIKDKRTILEIFTPSDENPKVLKAYWDFLKE